MVTGTGGGQIKIQNGFTISWERLNRKMQFYWYRKSHYEDKTILQPPYLHNWTSYTYTTASLYRDGTRNSSHITHTYTELPPERLYVR